MSRLLGSMRLRLAVVGVAAIYLPVAILLGVTVATSSTSSVSTGPGIVEIDEIETGTAPSSWVIVTAVALAPIAAGLAWWWAGRAVRPVEHMATVAGEIGAGELDRRIGDVGGGTEMESLAASFDAMLERLDLAASTQRELVEEASHELRTPLAVLQTNADVLLSHPEPTLDLYRGGIERSGVAAARLRDVVDALLVDARGRARTIDRAPADLVAVVRDAVDVHRPLADRRGVEIHVDAHGRLEARLDEPTVARAVGNLLDNAIRHAPAGSSIEVAAGERDDLVWVAVTDHGPGIPEPDQGRVFDRYWRGDDGEPGVGLGLPIAMHIAQAHGGRVTLTSPVDGAGGSRFELWLAR